MTFELDTTIGMVGETTGVITEGVTQEVPETVPEITTESLTEETTAEITETMIEQTVKITTIEFETTAAPTIESTVGLTTENLETTQECQNSVQPENTKIVENLQNLGETMLECENGYCGSFTGELCTNSYAKNTRKPQRKF